MSHPSFTIKNSSDGQFMFNLTATNGQIILTSELYTTKQSCENGIESVKANAVESDQFDKKTSSNNKPYFVLKAKNGEPIGTSELYESTAARDNGIDSVQRNAPTATILDKT